MTYEEYCKNHHPEIDPQFVCGGAVWDYQQNKVDELQKLIDHALDYANRNRNVSPLGNIALIDILKGEENETRFD